MTKSIISDNKPVSVTLGKGTEYYFCTCGRSKNQPFCDGAHEQFSDEQVGKEAPNI